MMIKMMREKWESSWSGAIVETLHNRLFLTLLQNLGRIYVSAHDGSEEYDDPRSTEKFTKFCNFEFSRAGL